MVNSPQASARGNQPLAPTAPPTFASSAANHGSFSRAPEIFGICLWVVGVVLLVTAFRGDDGFLPRTAIWLLRRTLGMGVFLVPAALISLGIVFISRWGIVAPRTLTRSFALAFFSGLTILSLDLPRGMEFERVLSEGRGGLVGSALAAVMRRAMGDTTSYVILGGLLVISLLLLSEGPLIDTLRGLGTGVGERLLALASGVVRVALFLKPRRRRTVRGFVEPNLTVLPSSVAPATVVPAARAETFAREGSTSGGRNTLFPELADPNERPARTAPRRRKSAVANLTGAGLSLPDYYSALVHALEPPLPTDIKEVEADDEAGIALVEGTLASFRIEAKVTNVKRGPVITRYEVQPAPGIRINRITNLTDDLALALAALHVRVEAPVPGKSVIGIEVPNKRVSLVRLRELVEMNDFQTEKSKLTFVLGKDIAGQAKMADLAKMPHLLISGATNSGKSVCLNSLITSILCRAEPEEVKFSLIDPKRVELTPYANIPHLFHPVVVDARDAVRALRGAIREMDLRYRLFASKGVRNIQTYNERLEEGENPLFYLVVVIDELADLMMTAAAEFERLICRLAQMARATGIHLIIATQRPSVNVLTGVIKANISSRIAFTVASQVDSRTILDMNGAERLIGSGDMLFHPIDAPKPMRIQGAFISEDEVTRVVEILRKSRGGPEYALDLKTIDDLEEVGSRGGKDHERDELFNQAVSLVRRRNQASASMLQREFEIGYPRAGRLVDQLEHAGIIGPQDGSKPREVFALKFDESAQLSLVGAGPSAEDSPWMDG